MLLIDEIDRSDQEFEAFLLEFLSDFQISIPERGTLRATERPVVVLTSNRTRDLHEALRRRCVYHWIDYPTAEREARIVMMRASSVAEATARAVVAAVGKLRREPLSKAPGIAEAVDWAEAATLLNKGGARWPDAFKRSIGVALKDEEDLVFISPRLDALIAEAVARGADRDPPLRRRHGRRRIERNRGHPSAVAANTESRVTGIVDAHHHIWRQEDLPWLHGPMVPRIFGPYEPIRRDYTIEEYLADIAAAGVTRSVYVQANWAKERFLDEVARSGTPRGKPAGRTPSSPTRISPWPMCGRNWSDWRYSRWCAASGCSCTGTTIRKYRFASAPDLAAIRRSGDNIAQLANMTGPSTCRYSRRRWPARRSSPMPAPVSLRAAACRHAGGCFAGRHRAPGAPAWRCWRSGPTSW